MSKNGTITIERIYDVLPGAVLLPIAERQKRPEISGWQKLTFADTQDPKYQRELREATNTGVLLGQASGNLCAVDADDNSYLADFLELNSDLARFATQGKRGGQVWFYVDGVYPHGVKKLKTNDGKAWGEFRADGGQSVIRGIHPDGMHYRWLGKDSPATIKFDDIQWPKDLVLPWVEESKAKTAQKESTVCEPQPSQARRIILEKKIPV